MYSIKEIRYTVIYMYTEYHHDYRGVKCLPDMLIGVDVNMFRSFSFSLTYLCNETPVTSKMKTPVGIYNNKKKK